MIKKYILGALIALSMPALAVQAATPMLNVTGSSNNNAAIHVTGGEIRSPVVLYYYNPSTGIYQGYSVGTTDINGSFTGDLNTSVIGNLGANLNMPVYVQVGGYESSRVAWPYTSSSNNTNTQGVMFSNNSPSLSLGGSGTISLSGGSGSYYISSNSNMGGVSASISGNTLNLYGAAGGQSNITVCSTGGGCGTFTTTVNGSGSAAPVLSSSNLNVTQGTQGSITLSGGSSPYNVSVVSGNGVSTTLTGNTLYINGNAAGTNVIHVCSSGGSCTPVTVNVQSQSQTQTGTGGQMTFALPLSVGQNLQVQLSGGNGSYYLQSPMSSPALASISGNTLMLNGSMAGSGTVTVCQTGGTSCLPIVLTVNPATQTPLTGTGGGWLFDTNFGIGSSNQDVLELQNRLMAEGYFTVTPTGYFGPVTQSAVMRYQAAHGISATGYVGVQTRTMLNQ